MKLIVVAACFIAAVLGAPNQRARVSNVDAELAARRALPALQHNEVRDGRGQYELSYSTAEGIQVNEKGRLVSTPDGKAEYLEIEGETRYIAPDGQLYITKYSAGLNGTHVEGSHLPVSVVAQPVPVRAQRVPVVAQPVPVVAQPVPVVEQSVPVVAQFVPVVPVS